MAENAYDCCEDDWPVWLRFETWAWAVLLLVHLSMVAFLVIHGRKDTSFRQAFYVFFVAVTLVDCALALLVSPGVTDLEVATRRRRHQRRFKFKCLDFMQKIGKNWESAFHQSLFQ